MRILLISLISLLFLSSCASKPDHNVNTTQSAPTVDEVQQKRVPSMQQNQQINPEILPEAIIGEDDMPRLD